MKKILTLVLSLVLVVGLLAGCSGKSEVVDTDSSTDTGSQTVEKKEITFWFWGAPPNHQEVFQKALVDKYNASQDEYVLKMEFRNTVDKDVPVALSANVGPDIVYSSGPAFVSVYAQENKVLSLNKYAAQYGWDDRLLGVLYDASKIGDNLYSLPNAISIGGVFYNKALFAEKGWEVPTTVEEMEAIMDMAIADGLYGNAAGNKGWRPSNDNFTSVLINHFASPTNLYDALQGDIPFNSPELLSAVSKTQEWYEKGYLSGDDYTNLGSQEIMQLLADKQTAFVVATSLYFQFAAQSFTGDLEDDLGFIPMPTLYGDEDVYDVAIPCSFSINANSKYPDEAAKIIDMMMTQEFMVEMTQGWPGYWTTPLASIDVDTDQFEGLSKLVIETLQSAAPEIAAGHFGYHPTTFFPPLAQEKIRDIDSVWLGVITPEEFLQAVDDVIKEEIENNLVAPLAKPTV